MLKLHPKSLFVGQNQIYMPKCHSTNDVAAELAQSEGLQDGSLVITDFQTSGRGQRGTNWESDSGKNLTMSFFLDTSFLVLPNQFQISMCTALAITAALNELGVGGVKIKWPNDIFLNNKKLGGVLIENTLEYNRLKYSIVGLGINIGQEQFQNPNATSLCKEGYHISRVRLAEKICENLECYFLRIRQNEDLMLLYLNQLLGINEQRTFLVADKELYGTIKGLRPSGKLLVETEFGENEFDIKEISFCF